MPNIAIVLKNEIQRLAKKEATAAAAPLKKEIIALRKTISQLRKTLKDQVRLTPKARKMGKNAAVSESTAGEPARDKARISAKTIAAFRKKMNISQSEFGKLAGTSTASVYLWEHKQGTLIFRKDTKAKVLAVLMMGKKEIKDALGEKKKTSKA